MLNQVLKGIHAMTVSTIVEYTFYEVNSYFVHRWEKARKQIASRLNQDLWRRGAKKLLTKVGKAAASMSAELFDPTAYVYSVRTATAFTVGREMASGRIYKMDLTSVTCMCCVRQLLHVSCSHMIVACRS